MEKSSFSRLRWKIIATTLCFSLIPLFALGFTIYHQFRVSYTSKIMENLRSMSDSKRSAIEIFLEERVAQLNLLASTSTFGKLKDQANLEKAIELLDKQDFDVLSLM